MNDICRVGDPMLVKAISVDDQDRVKLSRKAALAERGEPDASALAHPASERPPMGDRGGRGGPAVGPATAAAMGAASGGGGGGGDPGPRRIPRLSRSAAIWFASLPCVETHRTSTLCVGRAEGAVDFTHPAKAAFRAAPRGLDGASPSQNPGDPAIMAELYNVTISDCGAGVPRERRRRRSSEPDR